MNGGCPDFTPALLLFYMAHEVAGTSRGGGNPGMNKKLSNWRRK
jgi:hypothetical protein